MSKKTSLLKRLFFRKNNNSLYRAKKHRQSSHIEQLENRIAFAVDVIFGAEANANVDNVVTEQWMTILLDNGSDAFLKMDATPTNDLRIADNASFVGDSLNTVPNVDSRVNSIHVYNGSLVDRQVKFPSESGYSADFGLLPTSYPSGESLSFVINSRVIDEGNPITGTITLGDEAGTEIEFTNAGENGVRQEDGADPVWQITNSPLSNGQPINVSVSREFMLPTITVESAALANSGTHDIPSLKLDFDSLEGSPSLNRDVISGVVSSTPESEFKLFNELAHKFVPGTLRGEIGIIFDDLNGTDFGRPVSFQVETTGTGVVPVSFGSVSNQFWSDIRSDFANWQTKFSGTNDQSQNLVDEDVRITGDFNTETGVLTLRTEINNAGRTGSGYNNSSRENGFTPFPIYLDNVQIGLQDIKPSDDSTDDGIDSKFNSSANNFTLFPGADFSRSITIELSNTASKIEVESPIIVDGSTNGGQISLSAGQVQLNSGVSAAGQFVVPSSATAAFGTVTETVEINAPVSAPFFDIRVDDDENTGNLRRSMLRLSRQGSLSATADVLDIQPSTLAPAQQIYLEIEDGDAFIEGTIAANDHTYVMRSGEESELEGPYVFTTTSNVTGVRSGEIVGGTLGMLLANDTLGESFDAYQTLANVVDIQTSVERLRMQAASRQGHSADFPFPYDISIQQDGSLVVDAVASSSGAIDIGASGSLTFLASVNSMGDIKLQSGDDFTVSAPISTSFGSIEIIGPEVNVENSVRVYAVLSDELKTDVLIEATEGQIIIQDAVAGINGIELSATGPQGSILGDGRVIGDTIGAFANNEIKIRTDANGISVRAQGPVHLEDLTAAAFEIFESEDVTLIANGLDDVRNAADGTQVVAPALFADVNGALQISVSAPRGSIDLLHNGTQKLEVGDSESIIAGNNTDVDVMTAGGSVVIRSNSAREMLVSDAPSATSGAEQVRFITSDILPPSTSFQPSRRPGVYATTLTTYLPMSNDDSKSIPGLGGVVATDIRRGDQILIKDGMSEAELTDVEQQPNSENELVIPESFFAGIIDDENQEENEKARLDTLVGKTISGVAFVSGTTVQSISNLSEKRIRLSKAVLRPVVSTDTVRFLSDDSGNCNGIYGVTGVQFRSQNQVQITLRRATAFDTTDELKGRQYVRVTDGSMTGSNSSAGRVFASQGFLNQDNKASSPTPLVVTPVLSRAGFLTANAITTQDLAARMTDGDIEATSFGNIAYFAAYFDGVVLGEGRRVLVQNSFVDGGETIDGASSEHFGLYEVEIAGNSTTAWKLKRHKHSDEGRNGVPNEFFTGTVAITQGSLRTPVTGKMYQIEYDGINHANISYQEVVDFRGVNDEVVEQTISGIKKDESSFTVPNEIAQDLSKGLAVVGAGFDEDTKVLDILEENDRDKRIVLSKPIKATDDYADISFLKEGTYLSLNFDANKNYRTDIGTRNVIGKVTYQISSQAGDNDSPSSLGRILKLLQSNTAAVDRINAAQLTETKFHDSVQTIQLEQELPLINSPIMLKPDTPVTIDGSRISRTRNGGVVRSGALRVRLGPVLPSAEPASRRLYRGAGDAIALDQVHGLEIGDGADGTQIKNLSIGGFSNGSGVAVFGAQNVLLEELTVGTDEQDNPMPNYVGIRIENGIGGDGSAYTTVKDSVIVGSTNSGISLGHNTNNVRIVGSLIGYADAGNEVGVEVNTGDVGISYIGIRRILPANPVVSLSVTVLESSSGRVPLVDIAGEPSSTTIASIPKNLVTDGFEPGIQLFDRDDNRTWAVRKIELTDDGQDYILTMSGPQIDEESFVAPLSLEAGYFVDAPQRAESLVLPPGIDPSRLYLGQQLVSTVVGAIADGTYITSITPTVTVQAPAAPHEEAEGWKAVGYYGAFEIGLSNPIAIAAKTGVLFEAPARNEIGFNNDGIVLESGSTSIVSTDVTGSNFDGIQIKGVSQGGFHKIGGAGGKELTTESVTISANLASGISFKESFFADAGKEGRFGQVIIQGNLLGTDLRSSPGLANGRDGKSNIVIGDQEMRQKYKDRLERDPDTKRLKARYRPEDNPDQLEELEDFESFDIEGNAHFEGDPITIFGPPEGPIDDEPGWWRRFPSRR